MSTYRELTNMVLDELKIISDDSHFQEEHVIFLLDKYRSLILKQKYEKEKQEMPESNYQTICLDLEKIPSYDGDVCGGRGYLRSKQKIPTLMYMTQPKVGTTDYFSGNIEYTNRDRFKYTGNNKYLQNIIYSTIGPGDKLYVKSSNPQAYYLDKVTLTGIFEDSSKAAELACEKDGDEDGSACDVLDKSFPLEEALIPNLIQAVVKELGAAQYNAEDDKNNANDELGALANYLARNLRRRRTSDYYD